MIARNPPAASLPCCFSAFPSVSLSLLRSRILSLSLSFSAFLISSLSLRRAGGWFIGFIGAPARALRILFSNYTVTCNRPCQLAAPFFRSSSTRFFFFLLSPLWLEIRRGVQPLRRDRCEKKEGEGSRARDGSARDRTRQLILRILRAACVTRPPLEQRYPKILEISFKARSGLVCHK